MRVAVTFVIYRDAKKEFRWRTVSANGQTTGGCVDGYKRRSHCLKMVHRIIMGPHEIFEEDDHSHNRR